MWHVFTVRIEEKPGGWKVHSHRDIGTIAGQERASTRELIEQLKTEGYLGSKVILSDNEVGPGSIAAYVLQSTADVPKLASRQFLVMGIGNGPSGADWPMLALEWAP